MVIPGILENNWEEIKKKIEIAKQFTDTLHIDFIDGKFAPNTTFLDPKPFSEYSNQIYFEAHLMVEDPINYLNPLADAGFQRFLGHVEKMSDQEEFVAKAELLGEVGLAIDSKTSIDAIKVPYIDLDLIVIMAINAGFSGQEFISEMMEKVKFLRQAQDIDELFPIEIDGGINFETIQIAKKSGANIFVSNSCIFNSPHPEEQYGKLLKA